MRPLLSLALLSLTVAASAQGRMAFDVQEHEMGRLTEAAPGTHTFRFVNQGDAPLVLAEVESNCGCTIPAYTSQPVAPGGSGEVAVRYETAGRPGPFESAVRVTTDAGQAVTLRISGVVTPALATTGTAVGTLAFETLDKDLGTIPADDALQTSIQFANTGPRPIQVERVEAPDGVDVVFPRGPVFPDQLGGVFVTAETPAALAAAGGEVEVVLALVTDDPDEPVKRVRIRATVVNR